MTFFRTIAALDNLMNSILCRKCSSSSQELFSLGHCEHRFCRNCAKVNGGKPCPVCNIPAYATLAHIDKQLSNIAQLCSQMSTVLETCGQPLLSDSKKDPMQHSKNIQSVGSEQDNICDHNILDSNKLQVYEGRDNIRNNDSKYRKNKTKEVKDAGSVKNSSNRKKETTPYKSKKVEVTQKVTPLRDKASKNSVTTNNNSASGLDISIDRTPNRKRKSILMKRNAKGETLLQVATIEADLETVRKLLEEGANPNVKDYAGWTPLHEAVNHGNADITELLIKHGASVNAPGLNYDTPLHDAVSNYHKGCIQLLLANGANTMARNQQGLTPLDLARTNDLKELFLTVEKSNAENLTVLNTSMVVDKKDAEILCFTGTGLSKDNQKILEKVANLFNVKFVDNLASEVTHLITEVNAHDRCPRTLKYLTAILEGKWIVKSDWLKVCLENKTLVPEDDFEVMGCTTHTDSKSTQRGRLNKNQQLPGLFDGCQFYFLGKFTYPSREELIGLVKRGGGVILTREPRLHNLDDYPYTIPYHASEDSTLADCSIFVIYDDICPNPPHVEAQRYVLNESNPKPCVNF
ncbi:BRCA1-associated RING domain protein 1 [Bulinus truncatus]|nr:BRCA1-associated RING domain protein 1 [Bulinus truncatus]